MPEKTFTTYQIAKFCDVYPSSVIGWINAGKLKAYATPGGHHRVIREDLLTFLNHFHIPIPDVLKEADKEKTGELKRVLIVDDDHAFAQVLEQAFEPFAGAVRPTVCHNGVEALIQVGELQPHLIILDIWMPKMDGYEVCNVVKKKCAAHAGGVKIIAVSGRATPSAKRLQGHGIDAFFSKPVDIGQVLSKSAELLALGEQRTGS